jgi:ribosomal protein S18 acetylase RimI-like enzyme
VTVTALPHLRHLGVEGLVARAFRGADDFPGMAAVINARNEGTGVEDYTTTDDILANYAHIEKDPTPDMLMVDLDGELVGYARAQYWRQLDGLRVHAVFANVRPDLDERGLGRVVLEWCERRARDVSENLDGEAVFESWADREHEPFRYETLTDMGYEPITYGADMVRPHLEDIPDVPLPDGVEVRPVRPEDLRTIWEADQEAFKDHWGASETTEADYGRFLDFPHRDESLWKVAWAGDQVVGQVRSFIDATANARFGRARGHTEFISTTREWRRRGVARALLAASLRELRDRGMTEAALGVHTENPNGAFALYESLGFRVTHLWTTFRKPLAPSSS